jgi:hypothetical protein
MKIPYLPIIVVASALSLASADAMPDLGRETGKFIRNEESAPKNVRTFKPAKVDNRPSLSVLLPWRNGKLQGRVSILLPWHHVEPQQRSSILLAWHNKSQQV